MLIKINYIWALILDIAEVLPPIWSYQHKGEGAVMSDESSYWQRYWQTKTTRRRMLKGAVLGGVGLAAAAVVGCSDDEEGSNATPQPSGSGQAAEKPVRGGSIQWVNAGTEALPHIDIHSNTFGPLQDNGPGIAYSKVLGFDLTKFPDSLEPIGDLAESFENPDPTTYVFHLRRNVKWQNVPPLNGRAFKASDVTFSINRIVELKFSASLFEAIDSMETPDDYTLRIKLKRTDSDFITNMASTNAKIAAPEAVAVNGNLENGPTVGTGPWIFVDRVPEQTLKLRRNPDYFGQGLDGQALPYPEEFNRVVIADPNTQVAAFRTGQIMSLGTNGQTTRLLKQSVPDLYVVDRKLFTNNSGNRLWVSVGRDITKDIRVRQALSKVLDRQAFIDQVLFGSGWLSAQLLITRTDWLLPEDELKRLLAKDVQASKQLLQAAGVDLSTWRPIIDFGVPNNETTQAVELTIAQLKELGINGTANAADKVELTERIYQRGDFEMCVGNNTPTSPTNNHLFTFYHTKGAQTGTWKQLGDTQLDALIEQQAAELDPQKRGNILKDIQRRVIDLAVAIPLYSSNGEEAISPKLKNYKTASGLETLRYANSWVVSA